MGGRAVLRLCWALVAGLLSGCLGGRRGGGEGCVFARLLREPAAAGALCTYAWLSGYAGGLKDTGS